MSLIEVQSAQSAAEVVPVTTREIFIKMMGDSLEKAADTTQPPEVIAKHLADAESFTRLANEPTTDEMRLEQFGTPLPEGHPIAPRHQKIGASALR